MTLGPQYLANASAGTDAIVEVAAEDEGTALPAVLVVDEVAALLRVNRKTVYEALARGDIPGARRIGRTYRISRDAVLGWLHGQARVSHSRRNR